MKQNEDQTERRQTEDDENNLRKEEINPMEKGSRHIEMSQGKKR